MIRSIVFSITVSLMMTSVTVAQQQTNLVDRWLQQDGNGDGRLQQAETSGQLRNNFDRVDTDGDGTLNREELEALQKRLADSRGQANQRNRNASRQGMSTEQLRRQIPDDVKLVPDIKYREGDSRAWQLDLVMPAEDSDLPRPAIVFVHGGGWRNGDKRTGTFLNGAIEYAQQGYVCITVNYRLLDEAPFPACIEDVKCSVRWLRSHALQYNIDPDRIGAFGNSAGAHLVAMLGLAKKDAGLEGDGPYADQSSLVQAVCCCATPSDFVSRGAEGWERMARTGGLLAGDSETVAERAKLASPVSHASADAPPFLIIHGTADRTVPVGQGEALHEALMKAGAKDVTWLKIDGAGHGVFTSHQSETQPAMREFFERTLK